PAAQCPVIAPEWEDPKGVPVSAILFGGRRAKVVPLVTEARDWTHGVFLGSIMASETTAAAAGAVGKVRRDPFAMLPFCGYHMADYLGHWLEVGAAADASKLPKIFFVNWFRKSPEGRFLWPGYGESSRGIAGVCERVAGTADAAETPAGLVPAPEALNLEGLDVDRDDVTTLLSFHAREWRAEIDSIEEHYEMLGERLPGVLRELVEDLERRLG